MPGSIIYQGNPSICQKGHLCWIGGEECDLASLVCSLLRKYLPTPTGPQIYLISVFKGNRCTKLWLAEDLKHVFLLYLFLESCSWYLYPFEDAAMAEVVVIDDCGDEVGVSRLASKRKRPPDIDDASWKLIQQLQAGEHGNDKDEAHDEIAVVRFDRVMSFAMDTRSTSLRGRQQEEADRAMALKLHADEERQSERRHKQRRRLQEGDQSIAQVFQQEDERGRKRQQRFTKEEALGILTPAQLQAVNYVKDKAKFMHEASLQQLQGRAKSQGFSPEVLQQCLDYIRDDAPIVIHMAENTLFLLVKDTHYRNLFETNTSCGSTAKRARAKWEANMFGNCYGRAHCPAFCKPKYGALNYAGDIQGVNNARQIYGELVLILQPHVRHRSTFYNQDTGAFVATATLATNKYYGHILNAYDNRELSQVLKVCTSARIGGLRSNCTSYKEVQIHGPVCLATDILALSIPGKERNGSKKLKEAVVAFQEKTNCNILWQGDLLNPEEGEVCSDSYRDIRNLRNGNDEDLGINLQSILLIRCIGAFIQTL